MRNTQMANVRAHGPRERQQPHWLAMLLSLVLAALALNTLVLSAPAARAATFGVKVNFQDAATTPPASYVADWGQPYGARTGAGQGSGQTYGWVNVGTGTPLSLVGNGRNRNTGAELRLATFVHMQYTGSQGVGTPGRWELAVPSGAYNVTVSVGDAGSYFDSSAWISVENQNALAAMVPTAAVKHATATRTVVVTDGRLTLSPAGGTNTKINYVDVTGIDSAGRPYPSAVQPANGAAGVVTNASVTADNVLNVTNGAVDGATLAGNVTLARVSDGAPVAGRGATSGGGDTVSFQASAPLATNALYRFRISSGVKDRSGRSFLPFSSVFTTGSGTTQPPGGSTAAFDKLGSGASTGKSYTSLTIGPDGKLYAGSLYGQIYRWTIAADGRLSNEQVINTVRTHATNRAWDGAPNRTVIGLAFDPASTATNLILWITDNYAYLGTDVPDATGAVARLSGANLQNYQEILVNLPRSIKDHETNSIAFKGGKAYITQGSMNAMGAAEGTWKRSEHLLSAAVLQLDPARLPATLPLDVATRDIQVPARGTVPAHTGSYNPYAAGAPLTFYATGLRNAYDLVWHSNGHLYSGVNGSAAGGATPATPATLPAACANRPDGGYAGPRVPALNPNPQAETDYLMDVRAGKYYGHPNPLRCEYVLNAGNPTGYTGNPLFKVNAYPAGTRSDPNYDLAHIYNAGPHASANGTIEYKNTTAFGGSFAGKLVVVRYSANQELVAFDVANGTTVSAPITGIAGFTGHQQPLDVVEHVSRGNLYVSQLTDDPATTSIALLKPRTTTTPATTGRSTSGSARTAGATTGPACSPTTVCSGSVSGGRSYGETEPISGVPTEVHEPTFRSEWSGTTAPGARSFSYTAAGPDDRHQVSPHVAQLNKTAPATSKVQGRCLPASGGRIGPPRAQRCTSELWTTIPR